MAAGLVLLLATFPILAVAIVIYAGGYGIMWIARGTLPLALFGPNRYATLMGRLAFPSLIVQALAPSAGALVIEYSGAGGDRCDVDRIRHRERGAGRNSLGDLPSAAQRSRELVRGLNA
jgi:nitrate reductase NapE component